MTPERWRQIEDIYHAARNRHTGDRAEILAEACGADAELLGEVESLLAEDGSRAGMIDQAAAPLATPGTQFGPYLIGVSIGKGGMGEVWKARDSRLNRDVAIKISAQQFTGRFEREARAIAALNHTNICTIHDIGPNYLVMELIEGPTLAERIRRGPIPIEEALAIAKQIADALEAAHEKGIVHRDLKPANIKIRSDGSVKVLDFGIAKATGEESGAVTDTLTVTAPGMMIGTPGYMPPEQVRGETVDKRADIWAFGVVLYEMVTGQRPFEGKTTSDVLASVMKEEPDWARIPLRVQKLLRRCLRKDPRLRLRDIGDATALLEETPEPAAISRGRLSWVAAAVAVSFALGAVAVWRLRPVPDITHVVTRFEYPLPEGQNFTRKGRHDIALSPDGARLVYVANRQLYLRAMDQLETQPIRGTNEDPTNPVFSPDGQWLAYFAPTGGVGAGTNSPFVLRKIAVSGGAPVTLGQLAASPGGATWRDGTIAFGMNSGSVACVQAVPESGGTPQIIVNGDPKKERVSEPQLLADGKNVLFVAAPLGDSSEGQIVVQTLDGKSGKDRRALVNRGADPRVLPTGQLVYIHDTTLLAVPFDLNRLAVTGDPVPIIENFSETSTETAGQFSVSSNGTLAFMPGAFAGVQRMLVWVDREGHEQPIPAKARAYDYPRLSPDGTKIAVSSADEENDIWVFDLAKETLTRLTFGPAFELFAAWTPDNKYLLFSSGPFGSGTGGHVDIFRKSADGTGATEPLTQDLGGGYPLSVSPDGKSLLFRKQLPNMGLFLLPLDPKSEARPLLADPKFREPTGEISPDGRWIAYQSNESGRDEVYVRPFPAVDSGRWQISSEGGTKPLWSRSGRELFFATPASRMAAVPVPAGSAFTYGKPQPLFNTAAYLLSTAAGRSFDISPDGKRFLMIRPVSNTGTVPRPSIVVVTHWFDEVKARMPEK